MFDFTNTYDWGRRLHLRLVHLTPSFEQLLIVFDGIELPAVMLIASLPVTVLSLHCLIFKRCPFCNTEPCYDCLGQICYRSLSYRVYISKSSSNKPDASNPGIQNLY